MYDVAQPPVFLVVIDDSVKDPMELPLNVNWVKFLPISEHEEDSTASKTPSLSSSKSNTSPTKSPSESKQAFIEFVVAYT